MDKTGSIGKTIYYALQGFSILLLLTGLLLLLATLPTWLGLSGVFFPPPGEGGIYNALVDGVSAIVAFVGMVATDAIRSRVFDSEE